MIKSLRENPILLHQMRHARWPSLRTAAWIAAALTVTGLALIIGIYAYSPDGEIKALMIGISTISFVGWLLGNFGPLIAVVVATVATRRATNSQTYQMLRLSQLSEHDIVSGYVAAATYRLRGLLIVIGGLLLPNLVNTIHFNVEARVAYACFLPNDPSCIPPTPSGVFLQEAGFASLITIGNSARFITWYWLAITLGVWMAFRHRSKALVMSLIWMVLATVATAVVFWIGYSINIEALASHSERWLLIPLELIIAVINGVIGKANFNHAVHQVKKVSE